MASDYSSASSTPDFRAERGMHGGSREFVERRTMNRWVFRADHAQMINQQVQTELIISMLVAGIVSAVLWKLAPPAILLGWTVAIIISVGLRSLFISSREDGDSLDNINVWGKQYVVVAAISGMSWGALGAIVAVFGEPPHHMFALFVLAGICLTAYTSMQSSPLTLAAFIIPALLPITSWFFYQGDTLQLALGALSVVYIMTMLSSSKATRQIMAKSFSLGSHNTELIRKLVIARETAEHAKGSAEKANSELQEQIKERQLAQERIRASEQRMTAIFDSMQDTIYQTDSNGKIVWASPSVMQLLGYKVDEINGRNIAEFYFDDNDHEEFKHALDSNFGRVQHFETRLKQKDGNHIWISENSHYKYDEKGEIIGIEGTIRDITALKHAKEALYQEKERAQVTLGSIGDGVITTDLNGNIEYMNSVAEDATGWKLSLIHISEPTRLC